MAATRCAPALPALIAGALLVLAPADPSFAYLMLIRQGQESAGFPEPQERLGQAVATGDFDNDGYDDLAMGAPDESEDIGEVSSHGSVVVSYGSDRGLKHTGADYLTVGGVGDLFVRYGHALAAGDFNNDGYEDLAVGLPYLDGVQYTVSNAGEVWIHLGSAQGLQSTPDLFFTQDLAGDVIEANDRFGYALASGDFNLDGFADLAVGAPGEDGNSGAVSVFYGSVSIIAPGAVTFRPLQLGSTPEADGNFGWALGAANLFLSGHEDLIVGAPYRDAGGGVDAGQVFLMPGSATGVTATGTILYDPSTTAPGLTAAGQRFGFSVGAANFKGDALLEIIIGAPGLTEAIMDAGGVYVIADFAPPYNGAVVLKQSTGLLDVAEVGDQFGWAIAGGDFDNDGYDEIAVGAPYENLENTPGAPASPSNGGQVFLFQGGVIAPLGDLSHRVLHARTLNDSIGTGDLLGYALAFGRFDDSGNANLAIGCPGKQWKDYMTGDLDDAVGLVYVHAPWRQLQSRPHRSSVVLDCDGRIYCAQRPFQSVPPASTTKAMTALIAVEAIQSGEVDSNYVYNVPEWVANSNKVSGSQAGLLEGQLIRFVDLIKLLFSVSAGDACYAIGDILTGETAVWVDLENTILAFNQRMNQRGVDLGMSQTNFTNPSGRPLVNHRVTAYDFALLGRAAMTNSLYRYFAGTLAWADIPFWPTVPNGYQQTRENTWAACDGIKPGANSLGLATDLASAISDDATGRVVAAVFGAPRTKYGAPIDDSIVFPPVELMQLAVAECGLGFAPPPPGPPPPDPWLAEVSIPTDSGEERCAQAHLFENGDDDALVELRSQSLPAEPADARVTVERTSEVLPEVGDEVLVGFENGDQHQGMVIGNAGSASASLLITTSAPPASNTVTIAPGATHSIPAQASMGSVFELRIRNLSSTATARLSLHELGYVAQASVSGRAFYTGVLKRDPSVVEEVVRVCVAGLDPSPQTSGNVVYLVVRPPGAVVGVDEVLPPSAGTAGLQLSHARPNPFHGSTTFEYRLPQAGSVRLTIHDIAGRVVRVLEPGVPRGAGVHRVTWSGRDQESRGVATGMYFCRLQVGGAAVVQRAIYLP